MATRWHFERSGCALAEESGVGHSPESAMGKVWSEKGEGKVWVALGHRREARPLLVLTTTPSQFRAPAFPKSFRQSYRVLPPHPITNF